jgi:hypothetical protein
MPIPGEKMDEIKFAVIARTSLAVTGLVDEKPSILTNPQLPGKARDRRCKDKIGTEDSPGMQKY